MNNPLSFCSLKLDRFLKDGARLKSASGFVVEAGSHHYLVTNWHALSGRDVPGDGPGELENKPPSLKTSLHIYGGEGEHRFPLSWGIWKRISIELYDDHGMPKWTEHRANNQQHALVDIVALPIQLKQPLSFHQSLMQFSPIIAGNVNHYWAKVSAIHIAAIDTDVEYAPPDPVYVLGHPHNWAPAGTDTAGPAFWRTSSIASEFNKIDARLAGTFYIDPCAPEGMTGSPVIGTKQDRVKLLGVYSDRSTAEFGAGSGLVWDATFLKELIGSV